MDTNGRKYCKRSEVLRSEVLRSGFKGSPVKYDIAFNGVKVLPPTLKLCRAKGFCVQRSGLTSEPLNGYNVCVYLRLIGPIAGIKLLS